MQSQFIAASSIRGGLSSRLETAPLWVWCVLAVLIFALLDVRADPFRLINTLGDSDDATRLIEVRALLNGASWYDRTLPNIGAPQALVSHWSRIIDAPLALLLVSFERIMSSASATLVVRAIWPLLAFGALLYLLANEASRAVGKAGAFAALGLAVYAHSGVMQFLPGRIDHHNVMILCAVGGTLLLARSFVEGRIAWVAGALLGLGVAVGYEGLGLTAMALTFAAVVSTWSGRGLQTAAAAASAFAATLALALVLTETPSQWLHVSCDTLSANLVLLAACAAAGLALAARINKTASKLIRIGVVSAFGMLGLGLFAIAEPACIAGPFAAVDPVVRASWLELVDENLDIWAGLRTHPFLIAQFLISVVIALASAVRIYRESQARADGLILVVLSGSLAMTAAHIKIMPYATFLAVVPLATTIARLPPIAGLSVLSTRLVAFLAVNQHSILGVLLLLASLNPSQPAEAAYESAASDSTGACTARRQIEPLNALKPGLIVTDIDFGSYIAALTPHRVMVAPYHRLDGSIREAMKLQSAMPAEAELRLAALRADYVVICRAAPAPGPSDLFLAGLHAGHTPAFLEPLPLPDHTLLRAWRIKTLRPGPSNHPVGAPQ